MHTSGSNLKYTLEKLEPEELQVGKKKSSDHFNFIHTTLKCAILKVKHSILVAYAMESSTVKLCFGL